jgi:hypothetical protein
MFDEGVEHPQPDVFCYLSPHEARGLGFCLLASAEYADQPSSMPSSAGIHASGRPPHADSYVHQLEDAEDRVAILEFATVVDGKQVEGIDKLTFNDDGMITELKVMIRPASALQLVGARMAEEFPKVGLRLPS